MKAISIRQPWAHATIHLGRDVEPLGYPVSYQGPIAIHAGEVYDMAGARQLATIIGQPLSDELLELPRNAIVGVATVTGCRAISDRAQHRSPWGARENGPYQLVLADPEPLPDPIATPGRLGIWTLDDATAGAVAAALEAGRDPSFADLLRAEMGRRVLTREELADHAGVSLRSLDRYLAGGRPNAHNARVLAGALELDLERVGRALGTDGRRTPARADGAHE